MAPFSIVKHLDVVEQIGPGLVTRSITNPIDALALEQAEEALDDSVVPRVKPEDRLHSSPSCSCCIECHVWRARPGSRRWYPRVAPPPRSPLNADLRNALSWADAAYIKVVASGGGLGSVVNYIAHTDCLTILPHTVVFALHRHGSLSALPLELNHPNRTLGLLTPRSIAKMPVIENLTNHLKRRINEMLEQIRQHESAVMKSKFL